MTRNVRLMFWGAGALALVLAWAFGPLLAGYLIAGASIALILGLMGTQLFRAIGDWRLDHAGKKRTHATGSHEERRAA